MDPQNIKKLLVPVVAVAALIVIVALVVGNSGGPPKPGSSAEPQARGPVVKEGADATMAGMADKMPDENNWTVLPGGLKFYDVKEGTGDTVSVDQRVSAHYTGWLASNGVEFDSSRKAGKPYETSLYDVVKGWTNGIPGMKVGGIRRLYIPGAMAYPQGRPGIPPGADLFFEIKLVGFQ